MTTPPFAATRRSRSSGTFLAVWQSARAEE